MQGSYAQFLPVMLFSRSQKLTHHAQYYAHALANYCNYTTVHITVYILNS